MRLLIAITICCCGQATLRAEKLPKPTGASIVSPTATWEPLFTRSADVHGGLTEGPAVAPDGSIYFTDIPLAPDHGMIMRFDPKTKETTVFSAKSGKANGLIFDAEGYLLACEGSDDGGLRVSRWDVKTGKSETVADRFRGKRFNAPNDLCVDAQGRIYFTDPRYLGTEPREIEYRAVYRIDPDGSVIEITRDTLKPNGIALSPDGRTLYVADHDNGEDRIGANIDPPPLPGPMKIYAFPLNEQGTVGGERRTIVDFGDQAGCDGMTIDAAGNLYLTVRSLKRPGVLVVDPDGREVAFLPTGPPNQKKDADHPPVGIPSNAEFGIGDEINVLYVTVDLSLYRMPLRSKGYHVQFAERNR